MSILFHSEGGGRQSTRWIVRRNTDALLSDPCSSLNVTGCLDTTSVTSAVGRPIFTSSSSDSTSIITTTISELRLINNYSTSLSTATGVIGLSGQMTGTATSQESSSGFKTPASTSVFSTSTTSTMAMSTTSLPLSLSSTTGEGLATVSSMLDSKFSVSQLFTIAATTALPILSSTSTGPSSVDLSSLSPVVATTASSSVEPSSTYTTDLPTSASSTSSIAQQQYTLSVETQFPSTTATRFPSVTPPPTDTTQLGRIAQYENKRTVIIATASSLAVVAFVLLVFGICIQRRRRRSKRQQQANPSVMYQGRTSWPSGLSFDSTVESVPRLPQVAAEEPVSAPTASPRYYRGVETQPQPTASPPSQPSMANLPRLLRPISPGASTGEKTQLPLLCEEIIPEGDNIVSSRSLKAPSTSSIVPLSLRPGSTQPSPVSLGAHHWPNLRSRVPPQQHSYQTAEQETNGLIPSLLPPHDYSRTGIATSATTATTFLTVPSPLYTPYSIESSRTTGSSDWRSSRPRSNPFDLEES